MRGIAVEIMDVSRSIRKMDRVSDAKIAASCVDVSEETQLSVQILPTLNPPTYCCSSSSSVLDATTNPSSV